MNNRNFTKAIQCQNCIAHWYEPEDFENRQTCPYCGGGELMLIGGNSEYYTKDGRYDPGGGSDE